MFVEAVVAAAGGIAGQRLFAPLADLAVVPLAHLVRHSPSRAAPLRELLFVELTLVTLRHGFAGFLRAVTLGNTFRCPRGRYGRTLPQ